MSRGLLSLILFVGVSTSVVGFPRPASANVCACYKIDGACSSDSASATVDESQCESYCNPGGIDVLFDHSVWAEGSASMIVTTPATGSAQTGYDVYNDCAISNADALAAKAASDGDATTASYATPDLAVEIPGVTFTPASQTGNGIQVNYIGEYVSGVYNYLVDIGFVIATVFIMVAGLQYVFAANSGDTGKAKTRMQNAVAGFVLMLFISIILRTVNPALIVFNDLNLRFIDEVAYISDSGDTSGSTNSSDVTSAGISCPGSGDVSTIARSFIGRVAYRFGGKGGPAPYTGDKKTCDDGPCSSYCPEGNVCLDCSGFVGKVAECAGLGSKNESSGTTGIFSSAPKVLSCTADTVTTSSGTYTLTPGDLVGFKPGDYTKTPSFGHVWMYIGNNEIINSRGKGRAAGSAVAIDKLTWACKTYPLRFVDR